MIRLSGLIVGAAVIVAIDLASPAFAADTDTKLDQKLTDATAVYHELLSTPDRGVPEALLKNCRCIAVIPHVLRGAFVYGARFGTGVMSCRNEHGTWSPPSFVRLYGGSWGLQIGGESSDLVLFFTSERGARSLMTSSQITLGGQASVAAGPFGHRGEASTDLKLNDLHPREVEGAVRRPVARGRASLGGQEVERPVLRTAGVGVPVAVRAQGTEGSGGGGGVLQGVAIGRATHGSGPRP
jgi:lipid-binding SYLF domain-containing protein